MTQRDALRLAPIGRAEARRAGGWCGEFERSGVILSQANCLIAAAAAGIDPAGNPKDFPTEGVRVEHWLVGG